MKIIFLDIDGVLNSADFWERRVAAGGRGGMDALDPITIGRVNRLVQESGAKVVLSSAWRKGDIRVVEEALRAKGATWTIHSTTPVRESGNRIHEIVDWVAAQWPETVYFVILDDEPLADEDPVTLYSHLVQTDSQVGLTDADVERALWFLHCRAEPVLPPPIPLLRPSEPGPA